MIRGAYRFIRRNLLHFLIPRCGKSHSSVDDGVLEVVGFFQSTSGIGASARLCAEQLLQEGFSVRCISVESIFGKKPDCDWPLDRFHAPGKAGLRIIHLNPPMIPPYAISLGLFEFRRVLNVGYWAWELESLPREWVRASRYMNAVMCPSEFSAAAIRKACSFPVFVVPHPVFVPDCEEGVRRRLGLSENTFLCSSIFSFGSAVERKNPMAVVKAFLAAFGSDPGAVLVMKSGGGGGAGAEAFRAQVSAYQNIHLIEESWPAERVAALIRDSDAYISLHRSEGFGLTIAEALLLKTPVVTTAWSGNMDFCLADAVALVPYSFVPVSSDSPEFDGLQGARWADADVDAAALELRKIRHDPEWARARAVRAAQETKLRLHASQYRKALELFCAGDDGSPAIKAASGKS